MQPTASPCRLLSTETVAARLDKSPRAVCDMIRERKLPAVKVGRRWRVPESVIDGLVEATQPGTWLEQLVAALEAAAAATPWAQTAAPRESPPRPLAERALELHLDGLSWADIADECDIDQVDARILVLGELQKRVGQDTTAGAGVP